MSPVKSQEKNELDLRKLGRLLKKDDFYKGNELKVV